MENFSGKVVVITGASEGIGAELAKQLAAQGARLVLASRNREALDALAGSIKGAGGDTLVVRTDVGVEADCKALIGRTVEAYGGIDVLVNNAGVSAHALFEEVQDFSFYETVLRVNYLGAMWCTREALPHLKARRGLIVGVSSLAGKIGVPGRTAYCASKFAMAGFFEALRAELVGSGVDICMVFPGVVATATRVKGFGPDGGALGTSRLKEEGAMTAEECARQMVRAMASRRRELVMTARGRFGLWMKLIAPGIVDRMARNAVKR